jgi:hypothetical protein
MELTSTRCSASVIPLDCGDRIDCAAILSEYVIMNFRRLLNKNKSQSPVKTRTVGLRLQTLEDRTVPALVDFGFEAPALVSGGFQYNPAGSAWTFAGTAGVAVNTSAFTSGNTVAPQGRQVAFLQSKGSVRQVVAMEAGAYIVSFNAAQRGNFPSAQTISVLVDNQVVGVVNNLPGGNYSAQRTSSFTVPAGNHTITFQGTNLNGGDNTAFIDLVSIDAQGTTLRDSGFEFANLGAGKFQYNPTGLPWTFTSTAGVTVNNSPFTSGNALAPQGSHIAFLQGKGAMNQVVSFEAGTYTLNFRAAQRGNQASAQTFQMLIDGNLIGAFNTVTGSAYSNQTSTSFNLSAGSHTITFQGTNLNGGDNTIFIDDLSVAALSTNLLDQGFEVPPLSIGTFRYNPTGSPWLFSGTTGVSANGSAFTAANPPAPQGSDVSFVQGKGSISQVVAFNNDTYAISFMAAQRGNQLSGQTFQVLVDGVVISTFNSVNGSNYRKLMTSTFSIGAGAHTVTFQGTNIKGGDNTVLLDQVSIQLQETSLTDSGFEGPALSNGTFKYNPTGTSWSLSGNAGLATNGSAFTSGNAVAPQGNQVLFLQRQASASQVVTFYTDADYSISFNAAQRGNQPSAQTLQVAVDGVVVGTFNSLKGSNYNQQTTATFKMTAGQHTVTFQGTNLNGGDNTVFVDQVTVNRQLAGLNDADFELPALPANAFQYRPTGSPWSFTGSSGISRNNSAFTAGNPGAPQGNQVLLLQQLGSASQNATFAAGSYSISLSAARRGNQSGTQTFEVLIDGNVVGTFNNVTATSYNRFTTANFNVTDGTHLITLRGTNLNGGDNTVFIDQLTVTAAAV